MTLKMEQKLDKLRRLISSYEKVLVAFSGGSDSAFLLKVARDLLGKENAKAVIAKSPSLPESELRAAREIAREVDAELLEIETREVENPNYRANSVERCYFCKSELYAHLLPLARELGFFHVVNGVQQDDLGDWRPGLKAAKEYDVKSPLVEAGIGKVEIRHYSKALGLSTWSKPQAACLSSRIPFGTSVTPERLRQIEQGEEILKGLGFRVVRLRWFEKKALIEVGSEETERFFQNSEVRESALTELRGLGFETVDLHLQGYRSGRFNPQ
jgi:uncharacterized protein